MLCCLRFTWCSRPVRPELFITRGQHLGQPLAVFCPGHAGRLRTGPHRPMRKCSQLFVRFPHRCMFAITRTATNQCSTACSATRATLHNGHPVRPKRFTSSCTTMARVTLKPFRVTTSATGGLMPTTLRGRRRLCTRPSCLSMERRVFIFCARWEFAVAVAGRQQWLNHSFVCHV